MSNKDKYYIFKRRINQEVRDHTNKHPDIFKKPLYEDEFLLYMKHEKEREEEYKKQQIEKFNRNLVKKESSKNKKVNNLIEKYKKNNI